MKLINKDCLEAMRELKDGSVDCIITDPPYGVNFNNDFYNDSEEYVFNIYKDWLIEMYRVLIEGSHIYIFVPTINIDMWISAVKETGFEFKNILTTKCKSNNYTKNNFKYDSQFILYASKGKAKHFNNVDFQKTSDVWYKDKRNKNPKEYTYVYSSNIDMHSTELSKLVHPNQKDVKFIEILINISTNEGDTILEPFLGSGTTGVASVNTNRNFIGIEQDKNYFDIASKRIKGEE